MLTRDDDGGMVDNSGNDTARKIREDIGIVNSADDDMFGICDNKIVGNNEVDTGSFNSHCQVYLPY